MMRALVQTFLYRRCRSGYNGATAAAHDALLGLRDGTFTIILHLDDFGDAIDIDGEAALGANARCSVLPVLTAAPWQLLETVGVEAIRTESW